MGGVTSAGAHELRVEPIEQGEAVSLGLVTDVVGQTCEAVDREKMGPHGAREEPRRHGKVLRARLTEDRVGPRKATGNRHHRPFRRQR
jgi:hypothetical protein